MDTWSWTFAGTAPADEAAREALCTLGNGYLGTRGAAPESRADGVHYPGTYAAGCYNRLADTVDGIQVENESLVNLPNWLALTVRIDDGPWLGSPGAVVTEDEYHLDLAHAVLTRRFTVAVGGRTARVTQQRFVHIRRPHVCGLRTTITALDWSGTVTVRSGVDGRVGNDGVARYRDLSGVHLDTPATSSIVDGGVLLVTRTNQSGIRVAMASQTLLSYGDARPRGERSVVHEPGYVAEELSLPVSAGETVTADKLVVITTSRDRAICEPALDAVTQLRQLPGFDDLLDEHTTAWPQVWQRFRLSLSPGAHGALRMVRLHLFHMLQTLSAHSADTDAGVPARGLHGEAYRGHVLWDELFVLPMLNLHYPLISRAMLRYRYRRLPAACAAARAAGLPGAMFPWQSASDGREVTQRLHLNPASGRWIPDDTHRQRHVGLAVAYNVWQYCQATADWQFLDEYGAEIIVQVARFFAGLAEFDPARQRYVIRGIMGPDEFHTGYPGAPARGVDNNAYTNVMTAWLLRRANDTLAMLSPQRRRELAAMLGLDPGEQPRWDDISRRMFVPFLDDGVISQFEGYEALAEFDWPGYRSRYGDISRLDRILEAEGDDVNRYRVAKQADVLMLFYLLSADELGDLLSRCGYRLEPDTIPRTVEFYRLRTTHGSTLSSVVHAWVLARGRRREALRYFVEALEADVAGIRRGTTGEGVHLAAMAGSVDVLQRCFGGVEIRAGALALNPYWPIELGLLEFDLHYRDHTLRLAISGDTVRVACPASDHRPIRVSCRDQAVVVSPGDVVELGGPALAAPSGSGRSGAARGGRHGHGRGAP